MFDIRVGEVTICDSGSKSPLFGNRKLGNGEINMNEVGNAWIQGEEKEFSFFL